VRINEPFGDSVNWDLLPKSAISDITLIPGSNPVFGLNTLGGSLAETKNGFDFPGFTAQAYGGSFGRRAIEGELGGHTDRLGYFITGNLFDEQGWRDYTSSRVRQGFGKLSFRDGPTDIHLSFTGANNTLNGSQHPRRERAGQRHDRRLWRRAAVFASGQARRPRKPFHDRRWSRCIPIGLQRGATGSELRIRSLLRTVRHRRLHHQHASRHDHPLLCLYATDTLSITQRLDLTLAGRYNRAQVDINDQTGLKPALNSNNTFNRFNPAIGLRRPRRAVVAERKAICVAQAAAAYGLQAPGAQLASERTGNASEAC
jgi:hypothetical protein